MSWFKNYIHEFSNDSRNEKLVRKFMQDFPDKCLICSLHRFGVENGFTKGIAKEHECIDKTK